MNRIHFAILFAIACSTLVNSVSAQSDKYAPKAGEPHADFILPSVDDGAPIQLSAYRGKKILLMHFASW